MKNSLIFLLLCCLITFSCNPNTTLQPKIITRPTLDVVDLDFGDATAVYEDKQPFTAQQISQAIKVFYVLWRETFGDKDLKVLRNLANIVIIWDPLTRQETDVYDTNGNHYDQTIVIGLTLTPKIVWVWTGTSGKTSDTALIHELVHVALWSLDPECRGDADHEGDKVKAWTQKHTDFIKSVDIILKNNNL